MTQTITVKMHRTDKHSWALTGEYQRPSRGARERSSGIQLEPDEPAGFEIRSACIESSTVDIWDDLSEASQQALQEAACNWAQEHASGG